MLTSDLDSEEDNDKSALESLLHTLITELDLESKDQLTMSCRSAKHEVHLIMMRLLSVFMSRTKAGTKPSGEVGILFLAVCKPVFIVWNLCIG